MSNYARTPVDWELDTPPAVGPNRPFADSFAQAYDEQVTGNGMYSLIRGLEEAHSAYSNEVYQRTGKRLSPIFQVNNPFSSGDAFAFAEALEQGGEMPESVKAQMTEIEELRKEYPDLPGLESVWDATKERAQAAERRGQTFQGRGRNRGSRVGGFLGAVVGAMDPRTDAVNTATLGLGGVGRSVLTRIATEMGFSSAVEAVNQFTGVQRSRQLLGLSYGFNQALEQVALTGAGAGVIRGAAEGVSAGGRRIQERIAAQQESATKARRQTVRERADAIDAEGRAQLQEMSIYGDRPSAQRMFADELEAQHMALQRWDGAPLTRTELLESSAMPELPSARAANLLSDDTIAAARGPDEIDFVVGQVDPPLSRSLERVSEEIGQAEAIIAELEAAADPDTPLTATQRAFVDTEARIAGLEEGLAEGVDPQERGLLRNQVSEVRAEREQIAERLTADMTDAAALGRAPVDKALATEKVRLDRALERRNALLARRDRVLQSPMEPPSQSGRAGVGRTGTDAAERAEDMGRLFTESEKETILRFEAARRQLDETGELDFDGVKISKSTMVLTEDGEMSVEAIFKDLAEDDELIKAATACKVAV